MTGHVGLAMPPPQHLLAATAVLSSPKPHIYSLEWGIRSCALSLTCQKLIFVNVKLLLIGKDLQKYTKMNLWQFFVHFHIS